MNPLLRRLHPTRVASWRLPEKKGRDIREPPCTQSSQVSIEVQSPAESAVNSRTTNWDHSRLRAVLRGSIRSVKETRRGWEARPEFRWPTPQGRRVPWVH